tara:strand:- start:136 stop:309 length:174 start_codon:yes stop_codon:yes gene_type:complete
MKINNFVLILFEKIILIVIMLSLLGCSMNNQINKKSEKINKVEFKIKKTNKVTLNND